MSLIRPSAVRFFAWLRRLLYLWVRSRVVPDDPKQKLGVDTSKPICYVIPTNSLTDVLVLDEHCRRANLPRPFSKASALRGPGSASYIYLVALNLLKAARGGKKLPPSPLYRLIQFAEHNAEYDVQLVPVSVFWGRNPGKEERSIFKLLFFDDERAGILQKIFIVLAQGRSVFIEFGKPISLREQLTEKLAVDETARKITRVLRVYFRKTRVASMGPSISDRGRTIETIIRTKPVRDARDDEVRKKSITPERALGRARRYAAEISADMNYPVLRAVEIVLGHLKKRYFTGVFIKHGERLREIAQNYTVVYVPSHRSHMDYLLISYSLYGLGLFPPLTFAGINLNFWPVGGLLRRVGAFYSRRTFGGNRLYATVFNEYVHFVQTRGYAISFFTEGGRSRTGRLLQPKTGMLAMVVHSFLRSSERPVVLVPVYVGYDKVGEVRTYVRELRGSKKRSESFGQLVGAFRALRGKFGGAYMGIGQPIYLSEYLDKARGDWREQQASSEVKPPWMTPLVQSLAVEIMGRINSAAVAYPVAIFATVLLSIPHKALAMEDLLFQIALFREIARKCAYSPDVTVTEETPEAILGLAEEVGGARRFKDPSGDVIYLGEVEATYMTYYRNNILHLFVLPALVASFFQHNDEVDADDLLVGCSALYPLIQSEFFLRWRPEEVGTAIEEVVLRLAELKLLNRDAGTGRIRRPSVTAREFVSLKMLARTIGSTVERYSIATALLDHYRDQGPFERALFEEQCHLTAQRISILSGINDQEFTDKAAFKTFVDRTKTLGYLLEQEDGKLRVSDKFARIAVNAATLLSADIRQSIQRVTENPPKAQDA